MGTLLCLLLFLVVSYPVVNRRLLQSSEVVRSLERGKALLEQGRREEAEQEWRNAYRIAPNNPTVVKWLGTLYYSERRYPEAQQMFRHLAKVVPNEEHVLCQLAESELRAGGAELLPMATEDAILAAKHEPECFYAQRIAGEMMERKHDTKRAIEYLQQALSLHPADLPLRVKLISKHIENSDLERASTLTKELKLRYPGLAIGYALSGSISLYYPPQSVGFKAGEAEFLTALRLDPSDGAAHYQLGRYYCLQEKHERAVRHLEAASLLLNSPSRVLDDLSTAHAALGHGEIAKSIRALCSNRRQLEKEAFALAKHLEIDRTNPLARQRYTQVIHQLEKEIDIPQYVPNSVLLCPGQVVPHPATSYKSSLEEVIP
jgi:tetratricopeptide (TPR) repeat protein